MKTLLLFGLGIFSLIASNAQITGGDVPIIKTEEVTEEVEKKKTYKRSNNDSYTIISYYLENTSTLSELPNTDSESAFIKDISEGKLGLKSLNGINITAGRTYSKFGNFDFPDQLKTGMDFTYLDFGLASFDEASGSNDSKLFLLGMKLSPSISFTPVKNLFLGAKYTIHPVLFIPIANDIDLNPVYYRDDINISVFENPEFMLRQSFGFFIRYKPLYIDINFVSGKKELDLYINDFADEDTPKLNLDTKSVLIRLGLAF